MAHAHIHKRKTGTCNLYSAMKTCSQNETAPCSSHSSRIFDLHFEGQTIWKQGQTISQRLESQSDILTIARDTKKAQFGIERIGENNIYISGFFAHFNPKEYFFSRVAINLEQLAKELAQVNSAHMLMYLGKPIYLVENQAMLKEMQDKLFTTNFSGNFDIQHWHLVNKIKIPFFDEKTPDAYFYIATYARPEIMSSIKGFIYIVGIISFIMLAGSLALVLFFKHGITKHIQHTVGFAEKMAEGDFTGQLEINKQDEIGTLAKSLNNMVINVGGMLRELSGGVSTLSTSSGNLSKISDDLFHTSEVTQGKTEDVTNSAEEMSTNMQDVSEATHNSQQNFESITHSFTGLSATLSHISDQTMNAKEISDKAVSQAGIASENVNLLGNAANDIGKVTEAIKEISEQTNLLALNATIEAARAGEAGKGFAVVANEIKELAKQTAVSTAEISERIASIQSSTASTVEVIGTISDIINEISEIIITIATEIENQSDVVQDISGSIETTFESIDEVSNKVSRSSEVTEEIVADLTGVNESNQKIDKLSIEINNYATDLNNLSNKITELMKRFNI